MHVLLISPATVKAPTHKDLLFAWRQYGDSGVVGTYKVEKPLTESQLRRLPAALKSMLE